jgi:hypothetical protein
MMMTDLTRKYLNSSIARFGSVVALTLLASANVSADTPDPIPAATKVEAVFNSDSSLTVTVRGKWQWTTHHSDCNDDRFAAGWAVDWGDRDQVGSYVGTVNNVPIHVGVAVGNRYNPADNQVHYYPGNNPARCGVYAAHGNGSYNTGDWGPISHTYKNAIEAANNTICVVMYDVHPGKGPHAKPAPHGKPGKPGDQATEPKEGDLIAGGDGHNHDNSVQDNARTPLGNQCIPIEIPCGCGPHG